MFCFSQQGDSFLALYVGLTSGFGMIALVLGGVISWHAGL